MRILFLTIFLTFSLKAGDGGWSSFVQEIKNQPLDDLPWERLTDWVNDASLKNASVEKTLTHSKSSVQAFSAAVMLRRGFDEKAFESCREKILSGDEVFAYLFARYSDFQVVPQLEEALQILSRVKGYGLAKGLWQNQASERARQWFLDHYDLSQTEDMLLVAEAGLVEETRHLLERVKRHPTSHGQRARRVLREHLSQVELGGNSVKELREYQLLYQEARTVLQGFVREHRNIQFNAAGRRLLQRAYNLISKENKFRETFSEIYRKMREGELLLWEILMNIQEFYVDDNRIDVFKLMEAAARGITLALDRHSSYMGVEETKRSEERFSGNYVGIGAVVKKTPTGTILIESVFFGAPAWKAGLRSGDQILEVFGEPVVGMALDEAVGQLRGEPGTRVQVKVHRPGWDKAVDYAFLREAVNTPSLFVEHLPGNIAYAKLTQFIATSDEDLQREILKLQKELSEKGEGLTGLILDLRDNGGGYLTTAVNICNQFLEDRQLIVYSEGRNPQVAPRDEIWSNGKGIFKELPIVVLVNRGSASASEIVSGCLQDHGRATVVGERTFGKGSVQNLMPLDSQEGGARLRLTVAYYYLPSGESIHRRPGSLGGVLPDVEVKPKEETSDVIKEILRLQNLNVYSDYISGNLKGNKDLLMDLGSKMNANKRDYPNFDKWYQSLNTSLSPERACQLLRYRVRSLASEEAGKFMIADWSEDVQLQSAIQELAQKTGLKLANISSYDMLKETSRDGLKYLTEEKSN